MMRIIWFKNSHEHRLLWLKYGLMELHKKKIINFYEKDNSEISNEEVSCVLKTHIHSHTAIIKITKGNKFKFILVDANDSFFQLVPLIKDVDLYFCSGYNSDFFVLKKTDFLLSWQKASDVLEYKKIATDLIRCFGDEFYKVRKLCPIGPGLDLYPKENRFKRKIKNFRYKVYKIITGSNDWSEAYYSLKSRYNSLLNYRKEDLVHDVVLFDSLWGWPEHRIILHKKLKAISEEFNIISELKYVRNSQTENIDQKEFPIISNPINGNYEKKLVSSRLGVFATGFHFGWRNIMMVALMAGIPIYSDEIILEPYFDLNHFKIFYNKGNFDDLASLLSTIKEEEWHKIKKHNQEVFDRYMDPLKVAEYFINTISESF